MTLLKRGCANSVVGLELAQGGEEREGEGGKGCGLREGSSSCNGGDSACLAQASSGGAAAGAGLLAFVAVAMVVAFVRRYPGAGWESDSSKPTIWH